MNRMPLAILLGLIVVAVMSTSAPAQRERRLKAPASNASAVQPARMSRTASVAPRERRALASAAAVGRRPLADGVVDEGAARYVVHFIEFKDADSAKKLNVPGVTVFDQFDRFANVFIKADKDAQKAIDAIRASAGWVWDEYAGTAQAPPPQVGSKGTSRATPEEIIHGGLGDLTGRGVLIVILDTGLDFRNPDFITYDKDGKPSSRLRYFWDTVGESYADGQLGAPAPFSYPNGASIGTLYSRDDLNKELASPTPLISVWDIDGHGTSCAGVATGNGNNSKGRYVGVAPEAEIIGVRLGDSLESAYLLTSICGWIDKIAGDTPAIISCSFGSSDGGHDGLKVEERHLDARFPLTIAGRAICIAAGNDGGDSMHADVEFTDANHPAELRWTTSGDGFLAIYYDTSNDQDLRYVGSNGLKESGSVNPISGKYVSYFEVAAGDGDLKLYSNSGTKITGDGYLYAYRSGSTAAFDGSCVKFLKLIESPGSTSNAITVGSYDWNDQFEQHGKVDAFTDPLKGDPLTIGALSGYSSIGPLRNSEVIKPDVVSPGQYHAASAARNTRAVRDTTGRYELFNGTSAATPYTAGVLALVMQKKPKITLGEIKNLFKASATSDRFTGPLPNPQWGNGKLDLKAVQKMIKSLD